MEVESELTPRFGYGVMAPWVRTLDRGATLVAGPDASGSRARSRSRFEREERVLARFALASGARRRTRPRRDDWEVRSGPPHFTHSKMTAWVAFDRGVATV